MRRRSASKGLLLLQYWLGLTTLVYMLGVSGCRCIALLLVR